MSQVTTHPLDPRDAPITAAMRAVLNLKKGAHQGIETRGPFDMVMENVLPAEGVTFKADTVGGVPGLWVTLFRLSSR